jgi:opacity protein-like surface antigen
VEFTGGATAKDTGFAYQIGAGVVVPVTSRLSIDVGYRFNGVENLSDAPGGGIPFNWDLRTHSVRAAAVLNF